jgi:hypothetical protein
MCEKSGQSHPVLGTVQVGMSPMSTSSGLAKALAILMGQVRKEGRGQSTHSESVYTDQRGFPNQGHPCT